MKAILALHNNTIPPSAGFVTPNPTVDWNNIPFYVPTSAAEWKKPAQHPRRAGISSFGFGGTNFHIALEAYEANYHRALVNEWISKSSNGSSKSSRIASIHDNNAKPSMTHDELKSIEGTISFSK